MSARALSSSEASLGNKLLQANSELSRHNSVTCGCRTPVHRGTLPDSQRPPSALKGCPRFLAHGVPAMAICFLKAKRVVRQDGIKIMCNKIKSHRTFQHLCCIFLIRKKSQATATLTVHRGHLEVGFCFLGFFFFLLGSL